MIKQRVMQPLRWIFDAIIAPPFCAHCKTFLSERALFCSTCFERICPIVSTDIVITKQYSMRIFAISEYQEPLRSLIIAKSWSDIVASEQLAELLWTMTYIRYQPCDFFVPIPLHWTRRISRGYNQAEVMAHILAKKNGCAVVDVVKRSKRTPFQSALPVIDRAGNVSDAFIATSKAQSITGKHIILVDDLMTTGATLKAVAKTLIPYKPASISAVVACRVV